MKDRSKLLLITSFVFTATLLTLGGWWLYLLVTVGRKLELLESEVGIDMGLSPNLTKLVMWEGTTFLFLLSFLSFVMLFLYFKDQKKSKSMQDFFASLTHELKTPLASIRLQSEVLADLIMHKYQDENLKDLTLRLVEDTAKLETEMDKILQLSRLERGGTLNLIPLDLPHFVKSMVSKEARDLNIEVKKIGQPQLELTVQADEFALQLIFKNLFENSRLHGGANPKVKISYEEQAKFIKIIYQDSGQFKGSQKDLSTLFYKHNSSKGSGIGLYLVKKSLQAMKGELEIQTDGFFTLNLFLLKESEMSS